MAAENVMTGTPPRPASVFDSESVPPEGVLTSTPQRPTSAEEAEDDDPSLRGGIARDRPRKILFSMMVELCTAELPRWRPSMDFDQPRDLTDDE
jgi:hypothetical protein